jgi:hypothetical protein
MRAVGWRAALVFALLLFLFFADVPGNSRFWRAFFDAGHTALFGAIALAIRGALAVARTGGREPRVSLATFAVTVVLGALTEVLQTLQARGDPSLIDLLRDTAGAGAVLLIASAARGGAPSAERPAWARARRAGWRAAALLAAFVLLLAAGWTLLVTSARYVARNRAYPTLFALDGSWWEPSFIELEGNRLTPGLRPAGGGGRQPLALARLDLAPRRYSGIGFEEPYPDWRGRDRLAFTIVSDLDAPIALVIRIHDATHDQRYRDRFNRRLVVAPGVNEIRIPIEEIRNAPDRRRMDMRRVRGVLLFAYDLRTPTHVFLGPLRLE